MKTAITLAKVLGFVSILALFGCSEGPAEEAGERFDETVQEVENSVEDACEDVKENMNAENEEC
ncbi:hypothetical protein [Pseudoalteromonas piscicida]|uniref:Uncharacterized protein n=1 Tax=Pseudoalteromonas piscicida TaxID=43662 RepID=A0A2A5JNW8_PSEO7|nr:hypothetical protein [Pseudoalteromonas piscicida]PCK30941.1 hypothetical protein CEX98_15065 [Pseudoalteromonas piscicida]